jgi:predicted nucleotidyltransferase
MVEQPNFRAVAERFDHPDSRAVVLMGSYARGAAGLYSDVDLVRYTKDDRIVLPDSGSHLIGSRLVVVSDVTPTQLEAAFNQPEVAVETIQGLRSGRALLDRDGFFEAIQQRAHSFQWDDEMQAKGNRWASGQMVGWIEEVRKGLEGLRRNDTGRLLHGRFGCSWGLTRVMCVQRGVLLSGDNALFEEVTASVGRDTEWARLCRAVYAAGSEPSTLRDQVKAGLQLYNLTATVLADVLLAEDQPLISATVDLVNHALSEGSHHEQGHALHP